MTTSSGAGRRRTLALAPALLGVLLVAACSSGGTAETDAGGGDDVAAAAQDAPLAQAARDAAEAPTGNNSGGPGSGAAVYREAAVIRTGNLSLRSDDVGDLRFDVQRAIDGVDGTVTDEDTQTDEDGEVLRSRIVVRVAEADFDEAMEALEEVGDLVSSKRESEDVTTQVIDTEVRVRAQRASVRRIEQLLARATSIRDIVAIESQLTSRQAELDSLEQQQAWLADQTAWSTIRVHLERTAKPEVKKEEPEETGFLVGLDQGWTWLKGAATELATVVGRLLPTALVLLVLGWPVAWFLRRRAASRPVPPWASSGPPAPTGSPS